MALLFQFTLPKVQKMSDDMSDEPSDPTQTGIDPQTIESHAKAIQWLANKVKLESTGNELQKDIIIPMDDVMIKPGVDQILKKFGFIHISGKYILQKGLLNADLYSKVCETKLSPADSMMIVTARQISGHEDGGKKKKKRGIGGKNKKLASKKKLADEGMQIDHAATNASQRPMEIF